MPEVLQIYKCDICGNIIEVIHGGKGALVCCGQEMKLKKELTQDNGKEKHVPVVEKTSGGFKAIVGSTPHPMEEDHYIEWIEVVAGDKTYREFLKPGNKPEAEFIIDENDYYVREYCNLHGLWRN